MEKNTSPHSLNTTPNKLDFKELVFTIAVQIILENILGNLTLFEVCLISGTTVVLFVALINFSSDGWMISALIIVFSYIIASAFGVFPTLDQIPLNSWWEGLLPETGPIPGVYKCIKGFIISYGVVNFIIALGLSLYFVISEEEKKNQTLEEPIED